MSGISQRIAVLPEGPRVRLAERLAASAEAAAGEPVAVIGAGCRLPGGADSPAALWQLLIDERNAVREGPQGRWDLDAFYDPEPGTPGRTTSRWAGYLDDIEHFDAAFFGISAHEAAAMDPQHRLLLEVTWEALEHAGIPPRGLAGSPTGAFAGLCYTDYSQRMVGRYAQLDGYVGTGNAHSVGVGRISYLLGLTGPSVAVDTACSSSLVAIHLACQSLRMRECELALAGGSSLLIRPENMIIGAHWGMFSASGRCRSFDSRADGFVRSEGAAVVALKRLTDALRDGDRILAVVRGSAVNSDGRSQGLTAPSVSAQRAVLRATLDRAGVDPAEVGLIETHGTGTPLGDPIEFQALASVYGEGSQGCALGAIKSNLGHTEAAAGAAGFIKAVLCLSHGLIPPNLHFKRWNPEIPADRHRFFVPTEVTPWPEQANARLAAVSSFGISGTNAHVLLEQAPQTTPVGVRDTALPLSGRPRAGVFVLSAGSEAGLRLAARRLREWLRSADGVALADVAHTLTLRRSHHPVRLATVAHGHGELVARLAAFADGEPDAMTASGSVRAGMAGGPVWVFSGHGSQWPRMCRGLLDADPAFAATIDELEPLIASEAGFSVRGFLRASSPASAMERVQPALFAVQLGLAAAWRARGVEPAAVIGHSMGEVAAAVVSGALSLADGVRVICTRSRLMARIAGAGAMASVDLSAEQVHSELAEAEAASVRVAVLASPSSTVVAGATEEIDRLVARWDERGLYTGRVAIELASHSPQVDPILDELEACLQDVSPRPPAVRFYSTVAADARAPLYADGRYWRENLRRPVRFADAVAAAAADGHAAFVEISPHPLLLHAVTETLARSEPDACGSDSCLALPTVRREQAEPETLDMQLATLYCAGVPVDWGRRYADGAVVDLPTIAWDRKRHWRDLPLPHPEETTTGPDVHPLLGAHVRVPGSEGQHVWQGDIGTEILPWLADHRINEVVMLPAAAFCEMALGAATAFFGSLDEVAVTDLRIERPLQVGANAVVSTVLTPVARGRARVEIVSENDDDGAPTRHAVAELHHEPDRSTPPAASLDELTGQHDLQVDVEAFYAALRARGYHHGPAFAGLRELRTGPSGGVLGALHLPARARGTTRGLGLHPCLLDSCLQALAATPAAPTSDGEVLLPTGVGALRVHGDTTGVVRCVGHLAPRDDGSAIGQVRMLAADGAVLAHLENIHLARLDTQEGPERLDPMLHEIEWEPVASPPRVRASVSEPVGGDPADVPPTAGPWLVLGTDGDMVARVRRALSASEGPRTALHLPADTADVDALVGDALAALQQRHRTSCHGVVLLAFGASCPSEDAPDRAREQIMRLIGVLKSLSRVRGQPPRLWLVTRGAQQVNPEDEITLEASALRGLARVAMHEHADLQPTLVDLDPHVDDPEVLADRLASEVLAGRTEDEVAWRGDERLVARLVNAPLHDGTWRRRPRRAVRFGRDRFGLDIARPGDLDSLDLVTQPRQRPGPGEVEVRVQAASLNFRDVFVALGLHPSVDGSRPALGSDHAGVVTAVGEGVDAPRVGEHVFGLAAGAFGSFVVTPATMVAPLPAGMDPAAAAALPVAYLTAWYALRHVARLAPGERVLIHSASGGVGLAAIAVAQARGAEIFATAGNPGKRAYLGERGVSHVMDSRSLGFREQVREATDGQGVDVVLNSLSGQGLRAGLEVLTVGGRFIEIGKRDIYADSKIGMLPFRRNITLSSVDLDLLLRTRPADAGSLLRELLGEIEAGRLEPLPHRTIPLANAVEAFRTMAAANHVGKLVLTLPDNGLVDAVVPPDAGSPVRPDGGYLVTGGLGGLGVNVAEWLAARGAGRIVLNGRRPPSAAAEEVLDRLRTAGAAVEVVLGDIAEPGVAERLVIAATEGGRRLRGVVHAAGVPSEGLVADLDAGKVDRVWRSKAAGAWRLHEASAGHEPDWFVLFSSAAAMFGVQGAYAAANGWLDGFAAWRRTRGLPATSINWGPWEGPGMGAAFGWDGHQRISISDGIAALETILQHDRVRTGVFHMDTDHLLQVLPWATSSSFFAKQPFPRGEGGGPAVSATLVTRLGTLEPDQRRAVLTEHLLAHVQEVLDLGGAALNPQTPLEQLGFDSLSALQLRTRVEADLGLRVPATAVWNHPTLPALATYLLERMGLASDTPRDAPWSDQQPDLPTGTWFLRHQPRPRASIRLFCFPHLGSAASAYQPWAKGVAPFIELSAVQLPGRENRAHEPPASDLHRLTSELAEALAADPDPRPFAFFGHSGGGLLAFETARALRRLAGRLPALLAVSALLPPHHPDWDTRVRRLLPDRPTQEVARLLGEREALDDPRLAARLVEDMRADAALYTGYHYRPEAALECPISAFIGQSDAVYQPEEMDGWREQTSAGMVLRRYPGDHAYLRTQWREVVADLATDLSTVLETQAGHP